MHPDNRGIPSIDPFSDEYDPQGADLKSHTVRTGRAIVLMLAVAIVGIGVAVWLS